MQFEQKRKMFARCTSRLAIPLPSTNFDFLPGNIIFIAHVFDLDLMNYLMRIEYIITREKYDDTRCFGMDMPKMDEREWKFLTRDISDLLLSKIEKIYCRPIKF